LKSVVFIEEHHNKAFFICENKLLILT